MGRFICNFQYYFIRNHQKFNRIENYWWVDPLYPYVNTGFFEGSLEKKNSFRKIFLWPRTSPMKTYDCTSFDNCSKERSNKIVWFIEPWLLSSTLLNQFSILCTHFSVSSIFKLVSSSRVSNSSKRVVLCKASFEKYEIRNCYAYFLQIHGFFARFFKKWPLYLKRF